MCEDFLLRKMPEKENREQVGGGWENHPEADPKGGEWEESPGGSVLDGHAVRVRFRSTQVMSMDQRQLA